MQIGADSTNQFARSSIGRDAADPGRHSPNTFAKATQKEIDSPLCIIEKEFLRIDLLQLELNVHCLTPENNIESDTS
jgi:hypothetical protein